MYITLYHDPQSLAATCGVVPHPFDGNEIETLPAGSEFYPSRQSVFVEGKAHARLTANVRNVPGPLTLLLEYSRNGGATWYGANASVTFDSDGNHPGEWELLPSNCYGDTLFRGKKCDADGAACVIVSVAVQLRQ